MTPWFDPNTFGGLYGAIVGGGGGTLFGIFGAVAGMLASRGQGRAFVFGGLLLFLVVGLANLAVGVYAVIMRQPYGIWYPLVLVGFIMTLLSSIFLPVMRLRYAQAEARRMSAEQFRNG